MAALVALHTPRLAIHQDAPPSIELSDSRNVLGLIATFAPDLVIARFDALIKAMPESPFALSAEIRAQKIEKLTAQLDELERLEEHFIQRAEDEDQTIARRLDADPCAILGVVVRDRPALAKKPERKIDPAATAVA